MWFRHGVLLPMGFVRSGAPGGGPPGGPGLRSIRYSKGRSSTSEGAWPRPPPPQSPPPLLPPPQSPPPPLSDGTRTPPLVPLLVPRVRLALAVLAFLWREKTEREEADAIAALNEEGWKALEKWLEQRQRSSKALRSIVVAFNHEADVGKGTREATARVTAIRGTPPPPELGTVVEPKGED